MKKKRNIKFLAAIFLSLLAVTGGVLAMPISDTDNQIAQMQESVKIFEKNPERFLQTENLGLRSEFETPYDFSSSIYTNKEQNAINEGALEAALEEGDYDSWKKVVQDIEGFSDNTSIIDREDFEILAALHNQKKSENSEETNN